jgi:hypothetical protein
MFCPASPRPQPPPPPQISVVAPLWRVLNRRDGCHPRAQPCSYITVSPPPPSPHDARNVRGHRARPSPHLESGTRQPPHCQDHRVHIRMDPLTREPLTSRLTHPKPDKDGSPHISDYFAVQTHDFLVHPPPLWRPPDLAFARIDVGDGGMTGRLVERG